MQQTKVEEALRRVQQLMNGGLQLEIYCPRQQGEQWTQYALQIAEKLTIEDYRLLAHEFVNRCSAEPTEMQAALMKARELMLNIVETEGCDKGVIYLSTDGPTHYDAEAKCQVYDHENFSPLGDALIELWDVISKPALMPVPQWIEGPPNCPGMWIVIFATSDFNGWCVTEDQDTEEGPKYLRFNDGDTSEPIADYPWPPVRSFGPVEVKKATNSNKEA